MPATKTRDQGKTSFVKEVLIDDPMANTKAVNIAWSKAGMEGTISETLVNKMRAKMGLTGNLRGKRAANNEGGAGTTRPSSGKKRGPKLKRDTSTAAGAKGRQAGNRNGKHTDRLAELEADLDRLLFKVMNLGELAEVETALREARRRLYLAFVTGR